MEISAVKRKYKILYLDHGAKLIGGGQVNTLSLIKELDRNIFIPMVVSSKENFFTESARNYGVGVDILPFPEIITSIYRSSIKHDPISLIRYGQALTFVIWQVYRYIKDHNVDIVHPCDNISRIAGGIAAVIGGVPAVCHITDDFENTITNRILKHVILWTMSYILPVSDKVGQFFSVKGSIPANVVTVYTGIDIDLLESSVSRMNVRSEFGIEANELVFGIIGLLIPIKGHRELFNALALLREETNIPFRCIVIGDGPERESLQRLTESLSISEHVIFAGYRSEINKIIRGIDILMAPSHSEASSRVILEAGVLGIPAVGTRTGGIPEMIEENCTGLLVPVGDVLALKDAMKTMLDPAIRKTMGDAAKKRIQKLFCNKIITRKVEDIYLRALRESSPCRHE